MKVLFLGGTGIISTACSRLALERGHEVWLLNRGGRTPIPGARVITGDLRDVAGVAQALGGHTWDAVVDFIAFTPEDIERDLTLFRGRTAQYVFISSASAYQRPVRHYRVTEETPLENPYWDYSRRKIAAEERLLRAFRDEAFPAVIVRPSLTYGDTQLTLAVNSWSHSYTAIARLRAGKPLIIPGDGTSLWTCTHNSDFALGLVGLLGHPGVQGEAFHITSDEVLTWNQIYEAAAAAAGAEPRFIHMASDALCLAFPDKVGSLLGDKATSVVMDNAKIKRFVPGFRASVPYAEGVARTLRWFDADPAHRTVDEAYSAQLDKLIEAYEQGLSAIRRTFGPAA
jgi:nucleoside-diphosphate-sugar epimerase